jgi:hypothetical protein
MRAEQVQLLQLLLLPLRLAERQGLELSCLFSCGLHVCGCCCACGPEPYGRMPALWLLLLGLTSASG